MSAGKIPGSTLTRSRWTALVYLVLVFGSGAMFGAVAHRLYMAGSVTASTVVPKTPAQTRQDFLDKLRSRVGASPDQVSQVNTVLDRAKEQYNQLDQQNKPLRDKIDQERVAAILTVLNEDQKKIFLAWRAEVKAKREQKALAERALAEKNQPSQNASPQTR